VPLEAQACGTPVIAFSKGGALETVNPLGGRAPATGVWFDEQTPAGMAVAMEQFERHGAAFEPRALRKHALRFTTRRFEEEFFGFVNDLLAQRLTVRKAA
jgi:O-antigen biosynthesis alpha-1,3-mannosyltransferase